MERAFQARRKLRVPKHGRLKIIVGNKSHKREGMCVYLGVICTAVQKKPTQLVKQFSPK